MPEFSRPPMRVGGLLIVSVHEHLSICLTSKCGDSLVNRPRITSPSGLARRLDIEVSHALSMGLDESFAGQDFVAH